MNNLRLGSTRLDTDLDIRNLLNTIKKYQAFERTFLNETQRQLLGLSHDRVLSKKQLPETSAINEDPPHIALQKLLSTFTKPGKMVNSDLDYRLLQGIASTWYLEQAGYG